VSLKRGKLVSIRKLLTIQVLFSILKRAIFRKIKESKDLSGGVVLYAAESNPPIDAEMKSGVRLDSW
jgi:hypothetical protein